MKKTVMLTVIIGFCLLIFILVRAFNLTELDDISPSRPCDSNLIKKSDVLWVIPLLNNKSIADNKTWCAYISNFNKTIQLHGVYHTENEFALPRDEEYLQQGINAFRGCFNATPKEFKPPYLAWNQKNNILLKKANLKLKNRLNQITHKVYHCADSGKFPNWLIKII